MCRASLDFGCVALGQSLVCLSHFQVLLANITGDTSALLCQYPFCGLVSQICLSTDRIT